MNSVLAALFGGGGAGLSSLGGNMIREQDQQRVAAQRMAELQQQEASRAAQAAERRRSVANSLRVMGLSDLPDTEMDIDPSVIPALAQQKREAALAAQQAAKTAQADAERKRQNLAAYNTLSEFGRLDKNKVQYRDDMDFTKLAANITGQEDGQAHSRDMQTNALAAAAARAAEAAARAAERSGTSQDNTNTRQLSSEYATRMQKYKDTYDNVSTAMSAAPAALKGDGAAQMSVLYGFIKALDMDSAVREGEVDLARKAAPVMARVKAYSEAFARGEAALIPPGLVQQMANLMNERQQRLLSRADVTRNEYLQRGAAMGVTNEAVFPRLGGARKATDAELAAAMRETGNDPTKAAALLRARGLQ